MADMPADFWGGWIAVITITSLLGLLWLVLSIYFSKDKREKLQSPVWDSTLQEGFHPAPMWWFWMILIALIFSVLYLMLYPGLGSFKGTLGWSQGKRLNQSLELYNKKYSSLRDEINNLSIKEIQNNALAMNSASNIFSQECSVCHGSDGQGQANTFPNIIDDIWQWGGSEKEIETTLRKGRSALMVGWQSVIGHQDIKDVAEYIKSLSKNNPTNIQTKGEQIYRKNCIACHGDKGQGNKALGASKLNDEVWLYGSSDKDLYETIAKGRNGIMPAFDHKLDDTQIKLLVAWLLR